MTEEKAITQEDWGPALPLDERMSVYPDRPLADFLCAGGTAFAARIKNDSTQELAGVVCNRGHLPRIDLVNAMRTIDCPSVIRLRDSGVVHWPA
ncbi:MAG: hypothetical protein WC654_08260, partial [Patescibacteria group bacterium]